MNNSVNLALDPFLFCLPNPCRTADQIEIFVSALLEWSKLLRNQDICMMVSDAARVALIDDEEYPYYHKLLNLLKKFKIEVADHKTICDLTIYLLERTPSLEETFGLSSVRYDDSNTFVEPSILTDRLKSNTCAALKEMLVIISVVKEIDCGIYGTSILASTLEDKNKCDSPSDVGINSIVQGIKWDIEGKNQQISFPIPINNTIPLVISYNDLTKKIGAWKLWRNAGCEEAAIEIIELCVQNLIESGLDAKRKKKYKLGPYFLETSRTWGCFARSDYVMLLVESCARIVLGYPKNPLKEYRISEDSREQHVRDDGACAYRTHLTKKGAGLRLMLWTLPDGTIEFANVGDKDELVIR